MKRLACACALAFACALPRAAHADSADPPTCWQRVHDPSARAAAQQHRLVSATLERAAGARASGTEPVARQLAELQLRRLAAELEEQRSQHPTDHVRAFDLAAIYEELGDYARAIALLEPLLAQAPDVRWSATAWYGLAIAYAKTDRSLDEQRTYARALAYIHDPPVRVQVLSNWAEALLRVGDHAGAAAGYREALAQHASLGQAGTRHIASILAHLGLAVALDRSGDAPAARLEAAAAVAEDPELRALLADPSVFFVPEYEAFWYLALALQAKAAVAVDAEERATLLRHALVAMERWQAGAGVAHPSYPVATARVRALRSRPASLTATRARP